MTWPTADTTSPGLYTPGTVMLQPAGFVRGFGEGRAGRRRWASEQTPVTAFARAGSGWTLTTVHGTVLADKVILANGHLEASASRRTG